MALSGGTHAAEAAATAAAQGPQRQQHHPAAASPNQPSNHPTNRPTHRAWADPGGAAAERASISLTTRPPMEWVTKTTGRCPTPAASSSPIIWVTVAAKGSESPWQGRGGPVQGAWK